MAVLLVGIVFVTGVVLIFFGLVISTDGIDGWHRRRAKRPKIPAPGTNGRGGIYETGCKDCGMSDLPLDYYDRCRLCAELEELYGGVKAGVPRVGFPSPDWPEPPADISGIHMEGITDEVTVRRRITKERII